MDYNISLLIDKNATHEWLRSVSRGGTGLSSTPSLAHPVEKRGSRRDATLLLRDSPFLGLLLDLLPLGFVRLVKVHTTFHMSCVVAGR